MYKLSFPNEANIYLPAFIFYIPSDFYTDKVYPVFEFSFISSPYSTLCQTESVIFIISISGLLYVSCDWSWDLPKICLKFFSQSEKKKCY